MNVQGSRGSGSPPMFFIGIGGTIGIEGFKVAILNNHRILQQLSLVNQFIPSRSLLPFVKNPAF